MALNYKELRVYKSAYQAGLDVIKLIKKLSVDIELKNQLYRATISIPANIAEGYGRKSNNKDFANFLKYALGSTNEVLVYVNYLKDLKKISFKDFLDIEEEFVKIAKQLNAFIGKLNC